MPPRVSTGDRDAVLRQIQWCAAVQSLVNCHCQLEENPVGNVEPMQLVVQYLTKTAIKLPSAGVRLLGGRGSSDAVSGIQSTAATCQIRRYSTCKMLCTF